MRESRLRSGADYTVVSAGCEQEGPVTASDSPFAKQAPEAGNTDKESQVGSMQGQKKQKTEGC